MTMENVCQFFKYGFCKYRETCRQVHYEEICDVVHCENLNCAKRHPKDCKYFSKFKICKFGSFCLFSHKHTDVLNQTKDKDLEAKTIMLEKHIEKLEEKINEGNDNLRNLEKKFQCLENKLASSIEAFKNLCEKTLKLATDEVTNVILQKQNKMEQKLNENFNYFNRNLSDILSQLTPSHDSLSSQRPPQSDSDQPTPVLHTLSQPSVVSRQASFQCNICGKSFGSSRALENHTRKDHVPKS